MRVSVSYLRPAIASGTDRESVRLAIGRAADATGADFTYLLNQAKSESGLNPYARASTSSAGGLFQFIDQTWLGVLKAHGAEHGYGAAAAAITPRRGGGWTVADPQARQAIFALRNDPQAASLMAGEFAQDNAASLSQSLGREPNHTDLYFAAFLGAQGASRFLKAAEASPDASAAALFPREARVNRGIFYTKSGAPRSLAQVYALMGNKIGADSNAPAAPAPSRMTARLQMASIDSLLEPTATELTATRPMDVALADMPETATGTMLADRTDRVDVLRPNPRYAMLAYLMVSTPYQAS